MESYNNCRSLKNHVKHKNAEIVLAAVMAAIHVHFVQYALEAQGKLFFD